jgi:Cys-tRNA(Pro)/Cys-tRNA(Cys) deacylase
MPLTPSSSTRHTPPVGKSARAAGTPATAALARAGIPFRSHPYRHDPATPSFGLEAAEALGVAADRVLKTLVVDTERGLCVAMVPVDRQLDLKAVAAALGVKRATMADAAAAERSTGYVVGGISPIGQKRPLPTVLDEGALRHRTVFVSGGSRGFDIELAPAALVAASNARTAPISR